MCDEREGVEQIENTNRSRQNEVCASMIDIGGPHDGRVMLVSFGYGVEEILEVFQA